MPGAASFVPGPVPRTSLAPTSGPDALYSGLLECPVTTRISKAVDGDGYVTRATGQCGQGGQGAGAETPIANASACALAAAASAGGECTRHQVGWDRSKPAGCSMTATANGQCHTYFSTAPASGAASCGAGSATAPVAGRLSAASTLPALSLSINTTHARLTLRGPAGVWFGIGFNASQMADAPWTLIVDGHGEVRCALQPPPRPHNLPYSDIHAFAPPAHLLLLFPSAPLLLFTSAPLLSSPQHPPPVYSR